MSERSEQEIRRTLSEYCQTLDDGLFDDWAQVFTEDVTLAVMGQVAHGRDGVRALIEPYQQADQRGRHVLSEPFITIDGDTAAARTDYAFVGKDMRISSAGRYHDRFVHDGDRWRIAVREIVFLGDEPIGLDAQTGEKTR
jgi:3-phenylpropionate/cinnamic acid dioxygenase small subunit